MSIYIHNSQNYEEIYCIAGTSENAGIITTIISQCTIIINFATVNMEVYYRRCINIQPH